VGKKLKIEKIKKKEKWNFFRQGGEIIESGLLKGAHTEIWQRFDYGRRLYGG